MKNKRAVIPGSYDPITLGHLELIKRASKFFDEVIVLVCVNSAKSGFVSAEDRRILAEDAVKDLENVKVDSCDGLFADYCHENNVDVVVKGIRNSVDYSYEAELKAYNDRIFEDKYGYFPETFFIQSSDEFAHASSTFVRELIKYNVDVKKYVPNAELLLKLINRQ